MPPVIALPPFLRAAFTWLEGQPVMGGLIMLMVVDVFTGLFLAIGKKTLNSTISWRGMSKKAIMLLIVASAGILQPFLPAVPILNLMSAFYTLTEILSILENAAAAGVPLPAGLVDTLSKLRQQQTIAKAQKDITTVNNISVITPAPYRPLDEDRPKV